MTSAKILLLRPLLVLLLVAGCSVKARMTSVDNTFLEDVEISQKIENLPFDHAWVREDFDGLKYHKIFIKPVRIDFLTKDGKWARSRSAFIRSLDDYNTEAEKIAEYFHAQIVKEIGEYSPNQFQVVDAPGDDVLTVEIALTELEFSHPIARAGALAAPVPGAGAALSTISDPRVAFAARIYDPNGVLAGTAADRKFPPARIIDLNKLTATSFAREVVALWGKTMAEALNKGRFSKTKERGSFSWWIW